MKTKVCMKCHIEKSLTDFHKDKNRKDRLSPYCKECRQIESKEYWIKIKDKVKVKADRKKYRDNRKEEKRLYDIEYRKNNIDKILKRIKNWQYNNKEKVLTYNNKHINKRRRRNDRNNN